jgi:hypothetical protein
VRRLHLVVGILGVLSFVFTGQVLKHHDPPMSTLSHEVRLMFVSRHIYLMGAAVVNLVLGLYLRMQPPGWRRTLQYIGSVLILLSAALLLVTFFKEPSLGVAGRSWLSLVGPVALFFGAMLHTVASLGREPN